MAGGSLVVVGVGGSVCVVVVVGEGTVVCVVVALLIMEGAAKRNGCDYQYEPSSSH